jgi:hypothetical protein
MIDGDGDHPARAAARARLAARAAHVEGGMAAQAAAEAAVEAVAELAEDVHIDAPRIALASLDVNVNVARTPAAAAALGAKRKHIISPPMKSRRRKGDDGSGVDAARAARDLCGDLGEPKEALMRRAIETIGVVATNDLAIEVGRIEGAGGQMTSDGSRRRTPGGVFWALLKASVEKEDWDYIFEEEKEAQRERCRRRRRAASLNASLAGSPTFRSPASAFGGLKTPAAGLVAAAAKLEGERAPARLTMAERLSAGAGGGASSGGTPAKKAAEGSWAARAAASVRRVASAPAAAVSAAAAAAAATPAKMEASPAGSDAFTVVTPDNDPAVVAGGSYAARAKAAEAAEAAEAARIRAHAEEIAASKAKMAAKLAPAAEPMEEDDADAEADAPAPAPAPVAASAWSVSFASMVRAA